MSLSSSLLTQILQNGAKVAVESFGVGEGGCDGAFKKGAQGQLTVLPLLQPNL